MSPIEIAARAGWNEKADEFHQWETLSAEEQVAEIDGMRAGLLALAECDLPRAYLTMTGPARRRIDKDTLQGALRVILRAIANDGKDNG